MNEKGVHIDPEKITDIQDWPTPKSRKELQYLNGVIISNAQYLPHLVTIMAPLTQLVSEDRVEWRPIHEEAIAQIKRLASETPVLRPISHTPGQSIFLFTDTSKVGAGA
jgi:hypothetical protein